MSEIKVNSIKGVAASVAALSINNTDGTCTANITNNLSNRNLIINGAMQVAQRGTSSTTSGYSSVDRHKPQWANTGNTITQAQVDVASGTTPYTLGFRKALKISMSGAGTVNSNTYIETFQKIEAQDIANSGWNYLSSSSNITISFWVKVSTNQTFYVRLFAADTTDKTYCFSYTASGNNTWTKITKTIPGNANLLFNNDNGEGLRIQHYMFYGTDYTGSRNLDVWEAAGSPHTPDQATTWYTAGASTWEMTGLQLEVGSVATDFEHLSYANELTRCERYYQLIAPSVAEALISDTIDYGNTTYFTCDLHTPMRIAPSLVVGDHADAFRLYGTNPRNVNTFLANTGVTTPSKIQLYATGGSSGAVGFARVFKNTSGNQSGGTYATIAVNAEL